MVTSGIGRWLAARRLARTVGLAIEVPGVRTMGSHCLCARIRECPLGGDGQRAMAGTNEKLTAGVEDYLDNLRKIRASGGATGGSPTTRR